MKRGQGVSDAIARTAQITAAEAKALDPVKVRAAKRFYEAIFQENPKNLAAQARARLMERILELIEAE